MVRAAADATKGRTYNEAMQRPSPAALSALLVAVLLTLFYPALVLDRRLAPEAALHSLAPWRSLLGPYPKASPLTVEAASSLGPRLAAIAREPGATALWNPWIGGGRGGWLASAREGGTPLTLAAACLARPGWEWTALLALTVGLAMAGTYWLVRLLGFPPAAAGVGAATYALSGAASSTWLTADGAAVALGPLLLVPLLHPTWSAAKRTGAGAATLTLLLYSGPQAVQFVALAAAYLLAFATRARRPWRLVGLPVLALGLATATFIPRLWVFTATREPEVPVTAGAPLPAVGIRAVVVPFAYGDPNTAALAPSPPSTATLRGAQAAFLGTAVLLLAAVGAARPFPAGGRAFWVMVTLTAGLLAHLPEGLLRALGLAQRPFAATALGCAVLATAGSHLLTRQLSAPPARVWLGATLVGTVLLRLLPVAAHGLPFAPASAATLEHPANSGQAGSVGTRLVAFGATLPPDTAALFSLVDLRAASLAAEPRYAAQLRPREDGTVGFERVLDPALGRLGARLLMEPAQLHVISAEVFSRSFASSGQRVPSPQPGVAAVLVSLPTGAVRVALPAGGTPVEGVCLVWESATLDLLPDPALAVESDAWRWFLLPEKVSAGKATLLVQPAAAVPAEPTLLWDTSGLLLVAERAGARLWLATQARPLAFAARGLAAEGEPPLPDVLGVQVPRNRVGALAAAVRPEAARVHVVHALATRIAVQVHSEAPRLLVLLVKYRPSLWRAQVNGRPAATEPIDGVWTGLVIPAGTSHVELQAHLPWWVIVTAGAGALGMAALAAGQRGRRGEGTTRGVAP